MGQVPFHIRPTSSLDESIDGAPCDEARVHVACGLVTGTYEQTTSIYESRTGLVESGGGGSRGRYGNICCVIEWSALGEGADVWTLLTRVHRFVPSIAPESTGNGNAANPPHLSTRRSKRTALHQVVVLLVRQAANQQQ